MKLSVSNLAFSRDLDFQDLIETLSKVGITGVELAPTHLPERLRLDHPNSFNSILTIMNDFDMKFSGMQSLLYGHPELQLFNKQTWPSLLSHLSKMVFWAEQLGIQTIVFGSPLNRIKAQLSEDQARELAYEFFSELEPTLASSKVILTLEPNPTQYGADWLTRYSDCVAVKNHISSPWISAQIDTGCMTLAGEEITTAIRSSMPHHVHLSVPGLGAVPGFLDFNSIFCELERSGYTGWAAIEMLNSKILPYDVALESIRKTVTLFELDRTK